MFTDYIDLLKKVQQDGELISPSNVSANRSLETKELNNVQLKLDNYDCLLTSEDEVSYFEKELDWHFGKFDSNSKEFKQLKLTAAKLGIHNRCGPNSNYGSMMLRLENHIGITQKDWVVEKLKKDKNSRQAIAFYNTPNYQYWSNEDFVCCLTQMFNIKDSQLNSVVNSRSNDLINGFRYDSIWWRLFQTTILKELQKFYPDLKLGYLLVNFFSAHYYLKDEAKISEMSDSVGNWIFKYDRISIH